MQQGSVIQTSRKGGPDVWQFGWSEKDSNSLRIYRKWVIGTVERYRDEAAVHGAASCLISEINSPSHQEQIGTIMTDQLCEHFEQRELRSGTSLWSVASQKRYQF